MPKAGPHNPEYTQHHPSAIVDRDKAEVMARASKASEEKVIEHTRDTDEYVDGYADALNERDAESSRGRRGQEAILDAITRGLDVAQIHRNKADQQSELAGEVYEKVKERADQLRSGKPTPEIGEE